MMDKQDIFDWADQIKEDVNDDKDVDRVSLAITSFVLVIKNNKDKVLKDLEQSPMSDKEIIEEAEQDEW